MNKISYKTQVSTPTQKIENLNNSQFKKPFAINDGFSGRSYQVFKEELIPILCSLSENIRKPHPIYFDPSIIMILKLQKNITRKLKTKISHKHRCENPFKNISKSNP